MAGKEKPRGLLDMLGTGAARNAGEALSRRKQQNEDALKEAMGGSKPKKKVKK